MLTMVIDDISACKASAGKLALRGFFHHWIIFGLVEVFGG